MHYLFKVIFLGNASNAKEVMNILNDPDNRYKYSKTSVLEFNKVCQKTDDIFRSYKGQKLYMAREYTYSNDLKLTSISVMFPFLLYLNFAMVLTELLKNRPHVRVVFDDVTY